MCNINKICIDCKIPLSLDKFYKSKTHKHGVMSYCKKCFNQRCIKRWIKRKIKAITYKGGKCNNCNIQATSENYVIFDFHHLNPNIKDSDWSKLRLKSWSNILLELDKCVLVCSNCHRLIHHKLNSVVLEGFEPSMPL